MVRKRPFVGLLVDTTMAAAAGWFVGALSQNESTLPSIGYILLVQLLLAYAACGSPLVHELTGGPYAASWGGLASGVLSFFVTAFAITASEAHHQEIALTSALRANASTFAYPFILWVVVVEGSIAWGLLRGKPN